MSKIDVTCDFCGESFKREKSEVNKSNKMGWSIFCSRDCSSKGQRRPITQPNGNSDNLKRGSLSDEYSPFRYFMRAVRRRHRSKDVKKGSNQEIVDLPFLQKLWQEQNGKCAVSGVDLILPKTTTEWETTDIKPKTASLDRIDSNLPYTKSNVRFVSYMANICKNKFKDDDLISFCRSVVDFQNKD